MTLLLYIVFLMSYLNMVYFRLFDGHDGVVVWVREYTGVRDTGDTHYSTLPTATGIRQTKDHHPCYYSTDNSTHATLATLLNLEQCTTLLDEVKVAICGLSVRRELTTTNLYKLC